MRDLNTLNRWRRTDIELSGYGSVGNAEVGCFHVPVNGVLLRVIASSGMGWDHVSVSTAKRCPTWDELDAIARLFFNDDETAMQLHVPRAEHINHHPYCLHLWRPHRAEIPRPPAWMIGPTGAAP